MAYPFLSRQPVRSNREITLDPKPISLNPEWRCTRCDKLLGVCRGGRMHLRFARGHEYLVSLPAQATCRGCGTLNQASGPTG